MAADPLSEITMDRVIAMSKEIEVQLAMMGTEGAPIVMLLHFARAEASAALARLADVDAEDPKEIRKLQNDIARFRDLARWLGDIAHSGLQADLEIGAEEVEQFRRIVQPPRHDEQSALEPPGSEGEPRDGPYSE